MDGPWADYQQPASDAPPAPDGPWSDYAAAPQSQSAKPDFGSDEYVKSLADKYSADPKYISGMIDAQSSRAGLAGTPILGAEVTKAGAAAAAAAHSLTGAGTPGDTFNQRYKSNLDLQNELATDYAQDHPIENTAAGLVGGVLTMLPVASTSLGASALGLTAKTLPGMIVKGAAANAGLSAADAEARGEDPERAALTGAITGGVMPMVGRAAGSIVQGARNLIKGPSVATPANLMDVAGVDVPLSTGQVSGDQSTQMMEQNALRGGDGQPAQRVADQFFNQEQAPAVDQARNAVGQSFDQFGQTVADSPQDAASIISDSVRNIADASKQNYQDLYKDAFSRPGEFNAGAFEGLGQKIRGDLTLSQSPVIIDDVTTPVAAKAIQHIDSNIGSLRIQNRADPFGQPNPENITGVNLQGVDQARKQLVAMAQATDRGSADHRAMSRIIGAFDDHVEGALNDGLFTGDDTALDAIKDARSAYSQHQQLFKSQGAGDDVGRTMEKIIGRNGGDGATPTEVANYLYGQAKVGGTGLAVRLAQRMQNILGTDSPEWSAIRQGLWSRLSEATEGTTDFGPQKAANRIGEFLNGSGKPLSQVLFSGQERALIAKYAGLQQQLTPKPGTVNFSNTAPVLRMILGNTGRNISALIGDIAGGPAGAAAAYGASTATKALAERSAAGRIARSLYNSPAQNAQSAAFANQMARHAAAASRALVAPQNQAVNQ